MIILYYMKRLFAIRNFFMIITWLLEIFLYNRIVENIIILLGYIYFSISCSDKYFFIF
jgi:hypothetical protein